MKVVILAGGFGTRIAEYSEAIPKPMVPIGGIPIVHHVMEIYASAGHKDFYLALGYKAEVIKQYFLNFKTLTSDFSIDLKSGALDLVSNVDLDWRVTLVNTGLNSMTGGRLKRLQSFIGHETFMLTYGDGLADVDLGALLEFHKSHGKMVTCTTVRPAARFGELLIEEDQVVSFKEKPQTENSWINGGFFVINPDFFEFLDNDATVLESTPLEKAAACGELMAFKHQGFWQCMDTRRDKDRLEEIWKSERTPWKR